MDAAPWLRRLPVTGDKYFTGGYVLVGTCAAPGRVVRIKLRYRDTSVDFFRKLAGDMPRPHHRIRVTDELGQEQRLAPGHDVVSSSRSRDWLVLGLGPDPKALAASLPPGARVRYVECPALWEQMDADWRAAIPADWQRIETFDPLAKENILFSGAGRRLFPGFWTPFLAALLLPCPAVHAAAGPDTVLLGASEGSTLAPDVRQAFRDEGLTVRSLDRADLLDCLEESRPVLALSLNFAGLDRVGEVQALLDRAGVPVAVWCLDNPFLLLAGVRNAAWRALRLFVTDAWCVEPLIRHGARHAAHRHGRRSGTARAAQPPGVEQAVEPAPQGIAHGWWHEKPPAQPPGQFVRRRQGWQENGGAQAPLPATAETVHALDRSPIGKGRLRAVSTVMVSKLAASIKDIDSGQLPQPDEAETVTIPDAKKALKERSIVCMAAAKCSRSTARALPAGTWVSRATAMTALPSSAISTLSRPTAVTGSSERRELEHTSSASSGLT